MKTIIPILKELKSSSREDQMFYLSFLKEVGRLGKRLFILTKDKELGAFLQKLYKYLNNYKIKTYENKN